MAGDERLVYGLCEHLPAVRAAEAAALLDLFPRRLAGGALGVLALSAFRHSLHEAERRLDEVLDELRRLVVAVERKQRFALFVSGLLLGRMPGLGRA